MAIKRVSRLWSASDPADPVCSLSLDIGRWFFTRRSWIWVGGKSVNRNPRFLTPSAAPRLPQKWEKEDNIYILSTIAHASVALLVPLSSQPVTLCQPCSARGCKQHVLASCDTGCALNMPSFKPFGGVTGRTSATLFEIRCVLYPH